ncbi:hypothetical protein [Pyxidicoccus fallax]|nr:hypothetical protein [Pyxidicoccus fallax]
MKHIMPGCALGGVAIEFNVLESGIPADSIKVVDDTVYVAATPT